VNTRIAAVATTPADHWPSGSGISISAFPVSASKGGQPTGCFAPRSEVANRRQSSTSLWYCVVGRAPGPMSFIRYLAAPVGPLGRKERLTSDVGQEPVPFMSVHRRTDIDKNCFRPDLRYSFWLYNGTLYQIGLRVSACQDTVATSSSGYMVTSLCPSSYNGPACRNAETINLEYWRNVGQVHNRVVRCGIAPGSACKLPVSISMATIELGVKVCAWRSLCHKQIGSRIANRYI